MASCPGWRRRSSRACPGVSAPGPLRPAGAGGAGWCPHYLPRRRAQPVPPCQAGGFSVRSSPAAIPRAGKSERGANNNGCSSALQQSGEKKVVSRPVVGTSSEQGDRPWVTRSPIRSCFGGSDGDFLDPRGRVSSVRHSPRDQTHSSRLNPAPDQDGSHGASDTLGPSPVRLPRATNRQRMPLQRRWGVAATLAKTFQSRPDRRKHPRLRPNRARGSGLRRAGAPRGRAGSRRARRPCRGSSSSVT